MLVLSLQFVWAVVKLLAGTAILRVGSRDIQGPRVHRLAWRFTGIAFVLGGASAVVQLCVFAPWAFFAGRGTPVYDAFLRWNPAVTQSRTFLMVGLGLLVCSLPWLAARSERRLVPGGIAFLGLAMAAGGVLGWFEGAFVSVRFYSSTAAANVLELVVLLSALLVALLMDTMDRYLWLAMLVYAVGISLNVISFTALAWIRVEGAWAPPPLSLFVQVFLVLSHATMLGLAVKRLRLARRGVRVGSLLESVNQKPLSVLQ